MNVNIISNDSERLNTHTLKSIAKQHNGVYLDASSRMMESGTPEDILKIANRPEYLIASRSDINNQQILLRTHKINNLKFDIGFIKLSRDDRIEIRDMIHEKESLIEDLRKIRAPSNEKPSVKQSILSKYVLSTDQKIANITNTIDNLNNQLEDLLPGSSDISLKRIKTMRPAQLGIKDYNNQLDDIVPDTSQLKSLYPTTPYYDDLPTYKKERIAKLLSEEESLEYELKSIESRKITKPSTTKKLTKNIDMLKARLHTIMVGRGKRKPGIEEILPAALVDVNRLRTAEGRKSIPGFSDLSKGKRTLFGVRSRMYVECYDELQAAEKALDKYLSADTAIVTRSSELRGLINECISEIEEIVPGSSSLSLSQIKTLCPERSTIKKMFPSFSLIDKDMQTAYLRIIRLRNEKLTKIANLQKEVSAHEYAISKLYKGIHTDFRLDAVDFANSLYASVYTMFVGSIPKTMLPIWNTAYFIVCSPNQTICIDHISVHEHVLSPDQLSSLINYLSTSPLDKTIYISSTYTPPSLPSSITIISSDTNN